MHVVRTKGHRMYECVTRSRYKKDRPQDKEAGIGHHKCKKCLAIDAQPLERCKMKEESRGLDARNPAYRDLQRMSLRELQGQPDGQRNPTSRRGRPRGGNSFSTDGLSAG